MKRIPIIVSVFLILFCDAPTSIDTVHNFYDDLEKGTGDGFSSNEKKVMNHMLFNVNLGYISLIADSTLAGQIDPDTIPPSDTFPTKLLNKFNEINQKSTYIGNWDLGVVMDYRYFPTHKLDSLYLRDLFSGSDSNKVRYPKSNDSFYYFSRIAFNDDSTQAIVQFQHYYFRTVERQLVSLSKTDGFWYEIKRIRTLWNARG
jgi:hypothetical protein